MHGTPAFAVSPFRCAPGAPALAGRPCRGVVVAVSAAPMQSPARSRRPYTGKHQHHRTHQHAAQQQQQQRRRAQLHRTQPAASPAGTPQEHPVAAGAETTVAIRSPATPSRAGHVTRSNGRVRTALPLRSAPPQVEDGNNSLNTPQELSKPAAAIAAAPVTKYIPEIRVSRYIESVPAAKPHEILPRRRGRNALREIREAEHFRKYLFLRRQLKPWSDQFRAKHGRTPSLADVYDAGVPGLLDRFVEYLDALEGLRA